jgi:hypothetical protein
MLPMPPQTRRQAQRLSGRTACNFWIPLVTVGALVLSLLLAGDAAAQATAPAAQTTPAAQPAPGVESGDTAPPPGAAPIAPLAPLPSAAVPAPAPAGTTTTAPLVVSSPLPEPPAPRHTPIYRKHWFWGAIGLVAVTGVVLLAVALANSDPSTPSTRLGDMRAF